MHVAVLGGSLWAAVDALAAYNLHVVEYGEFIPEDARLFIPIRLPLYPAMASLKTDVLEHRFVAVYRIALPFSRVGEMMAWYEARLPAYGYEIIEQSNGALRFAGGWVARGTVEFSPGDEEHPTLIDIALVIDDTLIGAAVANTPQNGDK